MRVRRLVDDAWRPSGFCVPNGSVYPFQWLWDSCFHAVVLAELGDDRAMVEVASALAHQDPESGAVAHLTYWGDPDHHGDFWGRSMTSSITQPPMYGHALAVLHDRGFAGRIDPELGQRARRGLAALLDRRRSDDVLVPILHPWESGCDDSPRWDDWIGFDRGDWTPAGWRDAKGDLVSALVLDTRGMAVDSTRFRVASCGFNALVAWNIDELARVGQADRTLVDASARIASALRDQWDPTLVTWVDRVESPVPFSSGLRRGESSDRDRAEASSSRVRTVDAMLTLLVDPRPEAIEALVDPAAYLGRNGLRGVHPDEPSYDPSTYWRGPSWPQLNYLLWLALERAGATDQAGLVAEASVRGALASDWSEYWHPDTGDGGGARPQTWAGLALVTG